MFRRPKILYYSNGQTEKEQLLEKAAQRMNMDFISVTPKDFLQTVGYLAKAKGFPPRKISVLENQPSIAQDILVFCYFTEENLNLFLYLMKKKELPSVSLKATLTQHNCFWTFEELSRELLAEHLHFHGEE